MSRAGRCVVKNRTENEPSLLSLTLFGCLADGKRKEKKNSKSHNPDTLNVGGK